MPKPTRRERRKLAEQGKLAPRRPTPTMPRAISAEPLERTRVTTSRAMPAAPDEPPMLSDASEYAYVKSDLMRIVVLAGSLIGIMVALKFVLPQ